MLSLFKTEPREIPVEEKILGMSEHTIREHIPEKLRETGLFSETEIERAVAWLIEYRRHHHLDVIE